MNQEQYEKATFYSKELGDRNFKATNEAFKDLNKKYAELKDAYTQLQYAYATQQQDIANLKQTINVMLAKTMGTGATA